MSQQRQPIEYSEEKTQAPSYSIASAHFDLFQPKTLEDRKTSTAVKKLHTSLSSVVVDAEPIDSESDCIHTIGTGLSEVCIQSKLNSNY